MTNYPLLFDRADQVIGNGFVAGVVMRGRVLLSEEGEDGFWMYGVTPGGLAAGADSRPEAMAAFSRAYVEVLQDIACTAPDFAEFRRMTLSFFAQSVRVDEWTEAVAAVRATDEAVDWVRTGSADAPRSVDVLNLSEAGLTPGANLEPADGSYRRAA